MAGSVGGDGGDPEFQIAPMIDVLLVLLIFFMSITTDQVLKIDQSISLPVAPDAKRREGDIQNQAVVNIDWDPAGNRSRVTFGDQLCDPLETLADFVRPMSESNPELRMIIRGDAETPALEIQKVIEQLASAGVDDISLSGASRAN